jgi:hypothetical protein
MCRFASCPYRYEERSEGVVHCRAVLTACPVLRSPAAGGAPSSSQVPLGRGGDGGGVIAMVQEADVTHEALHDVTQEKR